MKDVAGLRELFAVMVPRHERVALLFSGGKESALLAHALQPWRERIELVHVNTGANFPHVDAFIREAAQGFKFVELRSDQPSHIRRYGLPSRVIPILNTHLANRAARTMDASKLEPEAAKKYAAIVNGVMVNDSLSCCGALRWRPLTDYLTSQPVGLVIHGQREADGAPLQFEYRAEMLMPIWDWSEADVMEAIQSEGVKLPEHYGEVMDSLDCWSCTAGVTPERMGWMRKAYPDRAVAVEQGMRAIYLAGMSALGDYRDALGVSQLLSRVAPLTNATNATS